MERHQPEDHVNSIQIEDIICTPGDDIHISRNSCDVTARADSVNSKSKREGGQSCMGNKIEQHPNNRTSSDVSREGEINSVDEGEEDSPYFVTWNGENNPRRPFRWTTLRKVGILATIPFLTLSDPLASSMFSPAIEDVALEFQESSTVLVSFIVSVYLLGGGLGALLVGPASERYGRLPVYHIGNALFMLFTIGCALANNTSALIILRFFEGCAGAVPLTIGGSTIRDIMPPEERGPYMALWGLGPLMGPVLGPISGGALSQARGWRWVFGVIAILLGAISLMGIVTLQETYEPVLLRKKAKNMRRETGNENYRSQFDEIKSVKQHFGPPITRPLKLLLFSMFSHTAQGLSFIGLGVGLLIGLLTSGVTFWFLIKKAKAHGTWPGPEARLPLMVPGAIAIPIGLLLYGWSVQRRLHYIVPIIGTGFIGMGLVSTLIPIQKYLVEAFGIHSASAVAANVLLRSILGAFLPLAGPAMFQALDLGWGATLLGGISAAFLPVPFLFLKYGKKLRENFPVKL